MIQEKENKTGFIIKAYTKKELRLLYSIPEASFRQWLRSIPETSDTGRKNWLTVIQVEAIVKNFGVPGEVKFQKTEY